MRHLLSLFLALWVTALCAQDSYNPLKFAEWIAMEPVGDVTVPLVHAPFVKAELADKHVGEYAMPVFVHQFEARKNVKRATLYVCGLGHFVAYLDGRKVGDHFLDPGWTRYDKEALYVTFDVTAMLQESADNVISEFAHRIKRGEHQLRVELGGGFYNIPRGRYNKVAGSFGQPKLRLRLQIEYTTGRYDNIYTSSAWQVGESQVTYSSIYGGEDVDLRRQPTWRPAISLGYDGPTLREQQGTEVVKLASIQPQQRWQLDNGDWVFDFGQNMSGIPSARLQGKAGQEVVFKPAELKAEDGSAYNKSVGNWQYHVTLAGTDPVQTEPKFSYTGFRYIQVHGAVPQGEANAAGLPVIDELLACHTGSVTIRSEVGTFECNVPFFNDVHRIIDWAIRSNLQSVITDCPHREKLGWLEQDYLMMPSMYSRYNLTPLYRKMMNDIEASQFSEGMDLGLGAPSTDVPEDGYYEGMVPTIAPYYTNFGWNFDDTPEWGSAFIISPWYHYEWTGQDELFRKHFAAMRRYIGYLTHRAQSQGYIISYGLGDWYDLGPEKPGYSQLTSQGVTATATYYYDVVLMARMARVLADNKPEEVGMTRDQLLSVAQEYDALAEMIGAAYNERFLHAETTDGQTQAYYDQNSQCANAISLCMGLVPEELRPQVLQQLINDIEEKGNTAGDVGFRYVLMALAEGGRHDVIAQMCMRDDVPNYAMQLKKGVTTLAESWQALPSVSNNHLMLGHILEWMYGYLGGLRQRPGSTAWTDILIEPHPAGGVTDCKVSYQSPKGPIKVHWWIEGDMCRIQYTAPKSIKVQVINPAETGELTR